MGLLAGGAFVNSADKIGFSDPEAARSRARATDTIAGPELRRAVGAQRTLFTAACTPLLGNWSKTIPLRKKQRSQELDCPHCQVAALIALQTSCKIRHEFR